MRRSDVRNFLHEAAGWADFHRASCRARIEHLAKRGMEMRLRLAGMLLALALPMLAVAETQIYKCTKADGSVVFAPKPCGANAKEIEVRGGASAPPNDAIRDISDGVEDSRCRDRARALYNAGDTTAIMRAQAELKAVENRAWIGQNEAQIQLLVQQDGTRAASLRALIASEQARLDSTRSESQRRVDDALSKCDDLARERREARGTSRPSN